MLGKSLPSREALSIAAIGVPIKGSKRIDLVITDYGFSSRALAHGVVDRTEPEIRCTIPLATLDETVSGETLRELQRLRRSAAEAASIDAEDLLRLVERIVFALKDEPSLTRAADRKEQRDGADSARLARLTAREQQVLAHVVAGHPNKTTAIALSISRRTVEHHRAAIMHKTRSSSVPELVRLALRSGFIEKEEFARQ